MADAITLIALLFPPTSFLACNSLTTYLEYKFQEDVRTVFTRYIVEKDLDR